MIDPATPILKKLYRKLEIKRAYQRLFDSEDGQLVLAHLLEEAAISRPSLTSDTELLLIREGQQRIVYSILRAARTDEKMVLKEIERIQQPLDNPYDT